MFLRLRLTENNEQLWDNEIPRCPKSGKFSWHLPQETLPQNAPLVSKVLTDQRQDQEENWSSYQVSKFGCQTSISGFLHVHHFCMCAQNVKLPKSVQCRIEILKRLYTIRQTKLQSIVQSVSHTLLLYFSHSHLCKKNIHAII